MHIDNTVIFIFDTDGDTSMTHPVTNKKLNSIDGVITIILESNDVDEFMSSFLKNEFKMSDRVYQQINDYVENCEYGIDLIDAIASAHQIGNYSITIIEGISCNHLMC